MNFDFEKSALYQKALETVHEHSMLGDGGDSSINHILVALSGGADSVALLDFLLWLSLNAVQGVQEVPYKGLKISAFHLNHGLRENASKDEAFVKSLCAKRAVPLTIERSDVGLFAQENGLSVEEAGRNVRYQYLWEVANQIMKRGEHCAVATGHNLNDNAETVILNITRGSGLAGLTGIAPVRFISSPNHDGGNVRVIRPILNCSREEIEHHCRQFHLEFVTDETNADTAYSRNRIRHRVLPELAEINSGVYNNISNLIELARTDNDYLMNVAENVLKEAEISSQPRNGHVVKSADEPMTDGYHHTKGYYHTEGYYHIEALSPLPPPIFARVIQLIVQKACDKHNLSLIYPAKKQIDLIYDKLCIKKVSDFEIDISKNFSLRLSQKMVRVVRNNRQSHSNLSQTIKSDVVFDKSFVFYDRILSLNVLSLQQFHKEVKVYQNTLKNSLDYGKIKGNIILRHRKNGDFYSPVNRGGTKTLKKLLSDEKIPKEIRDDVIIICDEEGIIWVEHFGCDERVKIDHFTKNVLSIKL